MYKKIVYVSVTLFLLAVGTLIMIEIRRDGVDELTVQPEEKTEVFSSSAVPDQMKPRETVLPEEVAEASAEVEKVEKQDVNPAESVTTAVEPARKVDARIVRSVRHLGSPRSTVDFFMDATRTHRYEEATLAMDFSRLPELRKIERQNYAFKLAGILRRLDNFDVANLPDSFEESECCLWPDQKYAAIVLTRRDDGTWRFSAESVQDIPRFFKQIEGKLPSFVQRTWLSNCPDWSFRKVAGLAVLQWGFLAGFVFLGCVASLAVPFLASSLILLIMHITRVRENYSRLMHRAIRPIGVLVMLFTWYVGLDYIQSPPVVTRVAQLILQPISLVCAMVTLIRFADLLMIWLGGKLKDSSNKIKGVLLHLSSGMIKIMIVALTCVEVAKIYGFSAVGILSGMGIGGIAVALAAQHTISNFFGSLTILIDKPFTIGDYVIVDGVEGKIETVGLRSTRIRTFYGSCIFIPNDKLAGSTIDNMGHREYRRFKTVLGLQYDTPVVLIQAFCEGVRKIIREHPRTKKDDIRVYVNDFGASSIDIDFTCFLVVPNPQDIHEEKAAREELILDILCLAEKLGVSFAFPSQTSYLVSSESPAYENAKRVTGYAEAGRFGEDTADLVLRDRQALTRSRSLPGPWLDGERPARAAG